MGPLSNAEKIRRYRNKRKDDIPFKESESKRIEKQRKARVQQMSDAEKEEYRRKARERQRKCRASKKADKEHTVQLWRNAGYVSCEPDILIEFNENHSTQESEMIEPAEMDFEIGDWVVVHYDDMEYPGEIIYVLVQEIVVSAMHRSGMFFKWPEQKDECVYPLEAVVSKITPPLVAGRRGQFSFEYFNQK